MLSTSSPEQLTEIVSFDHCDAPYSSIVVFPLIMFRLWFCKFWNLLVYLDRLCRGIRAI